MKNKLEDLRNHLFAQLERLGDEDCKLEKEVQRAASLVEVSNAIVETAKVEIDFLKVLSSSDGIIESSFLESRRTPAEIKSLKGGTSEQNGG